MKTRLITLALGMLCSLSSYSQGCWDSIIPPILNFTGDTVLICADSSVQLSVLNPQDYHSILWSTGDASASTQIDTSGQLWITVTFDTCALTTDTVITVLLPPVNPYITVDGPTEFCHGESVQLCIEPQPFASVLWSSGGTTPCITVTESGEYCTVVLDQHGCIDTTDVCVSVIVHNPDPIVYQRWDTLFCYDTTFVHYQWFHEQLGLTPGYAIPGANDYFYITQSWGQYAVQVTDSFGCKNELPFEVGIINVSPIKNLLLYPNPTNGEIFLELELKASEKVNLSIIDLLGKVVWAKTLDSGYVFKTSLDLQEFNKGIYTLQLSVGGENFTRKLVKQ